MAEREDLGWENTAGAWDWPERHGEMEGVLIGGVSSSFNYVLLFRFSSSAVQFILVRDSFVTAYGLLCNLVILLIFSHQFRGILKLLSLSFIFVRPLE